MKGKRRLKSIARASVHLLLVAAAGWAVLSAATILGRLGACLALVVACGLLIRSAFVYIPGFDPLFRIPWRGPAGKGQMAITFDDGPNGAVTASILDVLQRHQARATFFMIGENVDRQPELARRVLAAGHAVGSHTYSHRKLNTISFAEAAQEIDAGHQALVRAGLADQALFRAPHGQKTFRVVRHLRRRGLSPIAWTAGVFDTDCPSGAVIARRARRWIRPGSILLLHDGKWGHDRRPLLEALPEILECAAQRGLRLVTVPELLAS